MAFLLQGGVEDHHPDEQDQKELLVFGYHCKLFRDDEKASSIDAGEHLIPWMGDHRIMIDRYDGRGHLFDLGPYDADSKKDWGDLSADELRIERLCDEERYLELHTDIAEKAVQEEEELKRLNQELAEADGYQAVAFNYDDPSSTATAAESSGTASAAATAEPEEDEEDTPFVPPPELSLPKSMVYPEGNKLNSLIEKTAKFVSQHGGQMEIMIKTKQADNPQFEFLNFEHSLNPYYKHQVYMIKNGRYNPDIHNKQQQAPPAAGSKASDGDGSDSDDDGGYLHPSLMAKSVTGSSTASTVITAQYTQSQLADTAYGRLLKKLADKNPSLTNSPQRVATPNSETSQDGYYNYQSYDAGDTAAGYSNDFNSQHYYTDTNSYGYYQTRPPSPTIDIKPLIDRILVYIKKDGEDFEKKVIQKNDYRFSFLHPQDPNHQYYLWRKAQYLGEDSQTYLANKSSISFSIKQKDPEPVYIDGNKKAALPVDPDSEEEGSNSHQPAANSDLQASPQDITSQQVLVPSYVIHAPPRLNKPAEQKPDDAALKAAEAEAHQRKIAEQKLRDKLAAASREKLTQVTSNTKEKALQAERKKKAAMFVELLKAKKSQDHPVPIGPELPKSMINQRDSESRLKQESSEIDSSRRNRSHRSRSPHSSHSHSRHSHSDRDRRDRSNRDRRESRHREGREGRKSRSRRSPSPLPSTTLSSAIKRRSRSPSPSKHKSSKSFKSQAAGNSVEEKTMENNEVDLEYLEKMKNMLKQSRRKVYQEDLFGNE